MEFCDLRSQYREYQSEIDAAVLSVLSSGQFIFGPQVAELERSLSSYLGGDGGPGPEAISCANGTDALQLALMALGVGPGDEVVTSAFTFIATAETIALVGAKPVFCDIDPATFCLDPSRLDACITPKTRAIVPVSLYGHPADLDSIHAVASRHGIPVVEDAAQSFGAMNRGRRSGACSEIATTSFFPSKPLACYGDGGAVFTADPHLAQKLRMLRNHGSEKRYVHEMIGLNSRLDTIQAAVLLVKLRHFPAELINRQHLADRYSELLAADSTGRLVLPRVASDCSSAWAQYTVRTPHRDGLLSWLKDHGVPSAVHYPGSVHLQPCFRNLGGKEGEFPVAERVSREVLSLPMSAHLSGSDQERVASLVLEYLGREGT